MPPPPVLGGRRLRLQSPQYTGRSDIGSNGSSSIAFPQSAHFRSRCRTSTIRLSPKPIRSPFCSLGPSSTDCRRRSLQTDTVPQSSAKGKTASPRALRDARRPAARSPGSSLSSLHGRGDVYMALFPKGTPSAFDKFSRTRVGLRKENPPCLVVLTRAQGEIEPAGSVPALDAPRRQAEHRVVRIVRSARVVHRPTLVPQGVS